MSITNVKKLTPAKAWKMYVDDSVEMFVSQFHSEGITDIKTMCKRYAKDIPSIFPILLTTEQINYIADLLEEYINNKGYNPDELYSEEELDMIHEELKDDILENVKKYFKE
jgi:hypothetical protein